MTWQSFTPAWISPFRAWTPQARRYFIGGEADIVARGVESKNRRLHPGFGCFNSSPPPFRYTVPSTLGGTHAHLELMMIPRSRCGLFTLLAALYLLVVAGTTPDALGASSKAKSSQHKAPDPCQPPASPVFGSTTANRLLIALPPEPSSHSQAAATPRAKDVLMTQLKSLSRAQWEDGWDLNSPPLRALIPLKYRLEACVPLSDSQVMVRAWERCQVRRPGRTFDNLPVGIATVQDGRVRSWQEFSDTGAMHWAFIE